MIAARVATPEHCLGELLDDQDRQPVAGQLGDPLVELLDDERGEPHRQVVEHQQRRVRRQRARHRQHLLLATRQRAGELVAALVQAGEVVERLLGDRLVLRAGERPHPQVVVDRQVGEDTPAFGDQADAGAGERIGADPVDLACR